MRNPTAAKAVKRIPMSFSVLRPKSSNDGNKIPAADCPILDMKVLAPKKIPALKLPVLIPSASAMSATMAFGRIPKIANGIAPKSARI